MSFLLYQRSDPRHEDWLPLKSQQVRLRNLVQLIGVNLNAPENSELFFTLHVTPLSAPFFTSEKVPKKAGQRVQQWKEIEPEHAYYSGIKFSAKGCTVRIWCRANVSGGDAGERDNCEALLTWGVYFEGLHRLGSQNDWSSDMFENNAILFRTPFGVFTSESCIKPRPTTLTRYLVISKSLAECRPSYKCKLLASLHRKQRAIIEEVQLSMELKSELEIVAFSEAAQNSLPANERRIILSSRGRKIRPGSKKAQLALKKQIEEVKFKVMSLAEEKGRAEGRLQRIKKERLGLEDMNRDLLQRIDSLNNERRHLQQYKLTLIDKRQRLSQLRSDVFMRKKQLISELSVIYPLTMIDSVKRYSINGVQLPESDYQGYEGGGQASVALGYTAHLVSMLCFFLGIPLRYPIRHFGSRSRILDHITANIPEREREFPLYFKGKPDIFSIYGAYLLNKNIAQIRWYCGLVTQDLRATLPNLATLIHNRLAIKGWDQNFDDDSLEMAEEITEESDRILFRSENSISLDQGLDDLRVSEDKIQSNISSSVANLDYASNNSVAVGDVYRGRAQEKFLAGWKKGGVTAAEEIDPSWLVNSMDADSDCGRRVSTACLSRSYHSDIESSVVSNSSDQNKHRRRRVGQVSLPGEFPDGQFSGYGVPQNKSPTAKSRHTICTPPDFTAITDAGHQQHQHPHRHPHHHNTDQAHHFIPDDSLQAKQLRLLDRKISMYFGERIANSSARNTPVRRTRSFDRILGFDESGNNINIFASHPSNQTRPHEIIPGSNEPSGSDTIRSSAALSMNVGIGIGDDPHFSCAASNSGVSDIETDSCDFHVSPPVEVVIPTKVPTDEEINQSQNEMTATSPTLQSPETATTSSTSNACRFPMEVKYEGSTTSSSGGGINKNPVMPLDAEIKSVDNKNPSLDDFLSFDDPKNSDSTGSRGGNKNEVAEEDSFEDKGTGLDDESLWNRTEALMSSYQSFNLIRKSTIDPK